MRVLVVEDCAGKRSCVCANLQRRDYRVELVCDGREAISCAAREAFDLIILDLMQPSESSLLLLHEMREMNRDSKILILSTPAQISDRVTALIQGADDFLVKPYTAEDLFARIQHLENLLRISRSDNRGIELVIGEVRLAQLIARIIACLYGTSTQKRVTMRPPRVLLPTILVDARWMEHLLLNLLNHALTQSPPDAEITLDFQADGDTSEIVVGSSLQRQPGAAASGPVDSLALAKFCADCQGHGLQARIMHDNRLQLRVSNIRIN